MTWNHLEREDVRRDHHLEREDVCVCVCVRACVRACVRGQSSLASETEGLKILALYYLVHSESNFGNLIILLNFYFLLAGKIFRKSHH